MALTFGSEYVFNSATTNYNRIAKLDSTHFVTIYQDAGNSSYGTARIGSVSGKEVTYGAESVFYSASCLYMDVAALDSTHFVVVYANSSDSKLYSRIGVVSGTTISWGSVSAAMSYADCGYYLRVAASSSTQFSVQFQDTNNAYYSTIKKATVSGSTITLVGGSIVLSNSGTGTTLAQIAVSADNYINFYNTSGNYGYAKYNAGTEQAFFTGSVLSASAVLLDSTHFAVAYRKPTSTYLGYVRIGTLSGTSISFGSEYTFNNANTDYLSITALDNTHIVISFQDSGNSNYGTIIEGTISNGNQISFSSEIIFNSASTKHTGICALDSSKIVVVYYDGGNSNYGTAIIATGSATHELDCDISTSATIAAPLDRFKELATSISASASASASLYFEPITQQLDCVIDTTLSSGFVLDRIHELDLDIAGQSTVVASIDKLNELKLSVSTAGSVSVGLDKIKSLETAIETQTSFIQSLDQILGLRLAVAGKASIQPYLEQAPVINLGSVSNFNEAQTERIKICQVSSNRYAIAYFDYYSDTILYGRMRVITISGSTVTDYGTEYNFATETTECDLNLVKLSDGILLLHRKTFSDIRVVSVSSDGTITFGTAVSCDANDIAVIDSTHFVSYSTSAKIGTVSGDSISFGSSVAVGGAGSVCVLDSTHVAFYYPTYTRIGTISSGTISLGTAYAHNISGYTYSTARILDATHYVLVAGGSASGVAKVATVSNGNEISFSSSATIPDATFGSLSVSRKSDTSFIVSYRDYTNSDGKVVVGSYTDNSISFSPKKTFYDNITIADVDNVDNFRFIIAFNPYVSYENRAQRYGKVIICNYGILVELLDTIHGKASVSNTMNYAVGLKLIASGSSSLSASAPVARNLSTSISEVSSVGYDLYHELGLSTQIAQSSYVTAFVQRARNLALAIEGLSSATAGLDYIRALSVLIEQTTSVNSYLQAEKELALAIETVQDMAATAEAHIGLDVDIQSVSTAALSIINLCNLTDAMAATGSVTAGLSLDVLLASVINPHSELYTQAYLELAGNCVVDANADFALTMDHVVQLVNIISAKATTASEMELVHLLQTFVDSKASVFTSFNTVIDAIVNMEGFSALTADGLIFHGVDLICALDAQAQAFFTQERIAQLVLEVDTSASFVSVLQNLLRAYLEFKGELHSGLELSGILYDRINFTGKIKYYEIEFIGGLK